MLGGSVFQLMDGHDDPFFASHREHMLRMNEMFRDPFANYGMGMGMPMGQHMLTAGPQVQQHLPRALPQALPQNQQLSPFGMFNMGFGGMFGNMGNMQNMMRDMHQIQNFGNVQPQHAHSNPNAHSFSSSSFTSYTNTGDGAPKVYQASSSTRTAPGGIKETKKAVRDSEKGIESMAIGHHIHDRAHIRERSRNAHTGDQDENEEFINLDDHEGPTFHREWEDKTRQPMRGVEYGRRGGQDRYRPYADRQLALPAPEQDGAHERGHQESEHERERKGHERERKGHTRKVSYRDRD